MKNQPSKKFDLIFADAPYGNTQALEELPLLIIQNRWLTPEGLCAIEHRSSEDPKLVVSFGAKIIRELNAGEASFTILQYA